jgi:hypothetical protein
MQDTNEVKFSIKVKKLNVADPNGKGLIKIIE